MAQHQTIITVGNRSFYLEYAIGRIEKSRGTDMEFVWLLAQWFSTPEGTEYHEQACAKRAEIEEAKASEKKARMNKVNQKPMPSKEQMPKGFDSSRPQRQQTHRQDYSGTGQGLKRAAKERYETKHGWEA